MLLALLPVVILITAYIIGRRAFVGRLEQYRPSVKEALQKLHDLSTPMHFFTEEEERAFKDAHGSISSIVYKKILHSIFKRSTDNISGFSYLVSSIARLPEIRKKNNRIVRTLEELQISLPIAQKEYEYIFSGKKYIAEHAKEGFLSKWRELADSIATIEREGYGAYLPEGGRDFKGQYDSAGVLKDSLNVRFINYEQHRQKDYFNTLLKYPLDLQQREAIITMEDNCLVVSSAGSGKTSTIEGRVHYLVDKLNVDPKTILLVTFTNKASNSLTERLGIDGLRCFTFHKLASDIIAEATGHRPSFADESLKTVAYEELLSNKTVLAAINDYFNNYISATDEFEYSSMKEYIQARVRIGHKAFFPDMDGRSIFTKSEQEKRICYYLSVNGVKFRYEQNYEVQTSDPQHRQYQPDFSIYFTAPDGSIKRIYLEHFGIDRNGRVPRFFGEGNPRGWQGANEEYNNGILWKRQTHAENGTTLIETTSADFDDGRFEEKLLQKLRAHGVPINPLSPEEIYDATVRSKKGTERTFIGLLTTFQSLLKASCSNVQDIDPSKWSDKKQRGKMVFLFENIVKPFCEKYESLLAERQEIDFTDAIIKATEICNREKPREYNHIIVDEFQDISMDRYRFVQSLRSTMPFTYLFCVGDDWQSIYRFAGSDMALFKNFSSYFGFTKNCPIETTYRFGQPLISHSSNFILKNPAQTAKNVKPASEDKKSELYFCGYQDYNLSSAVKSIVDSLPVDESVMFLGRYGFNIQDLEHVPGMRATLKDDRGTVQYNGRTLQFLTVHKAKGLEADNVILLGCNAGVYGFPSNIADDPILKLVLSEDDQFEYGEERRLFYVAITRCRKRVYVLYNTEYPSPFIGEFIPGIPEQELCPHCHVGKKVLIKEGISRIGKHYKLWGCTCNSMGCDYFEPEWDEE